MRTAHPVAVVALYVVMSLGTLWIVVGLAHWWCRLRDRGRRHHARTITAEHDIAHIRALARRRLAEMAAAKERTT